MLVATSIYLINIGVTFFDYSQGYPVYQKALFRHCYRSIVVVSRTKYGLSLISFATLLSTISFPTRLEYIGSNVLTIFEKHGLS